MLRRALGGEGESKWTKEATHKAQSTLALGTRRNYSGSQDRSEHRGTLTLALCRCHGGRTQQSRWPFPLSQAGRSVGVSRSEPSWPLREYSKTVEECSLSGRKMRLVCFSLDSPLQWPSITGRTDELERWIRPVSNLCPSSATEEVKTREWRGFGMDPGPGVGRGWAGGGARQGSSMSWWDHVVEVSKQVKSMHSQCEIWEGILAEGAFTRMSDKKQESWLCAPWRASQAAPVVKNLSTQEIEQTRLQSLGREDPLEKRMATHSRTLAWRIPWTEEPGGLRSIGSQSVEHDWIDLGCTQCKMYLMCKISSFLVQFPLGCHGWISSSGVSSL